MSRRSKNNSPVITISIIAVALILGLSIYFYFFSNKINWSVNYNPKDNQPYGTLVLNNLLSDIRGNQEFTFIKDSTYKYLNSDPTPEIDNFVFVGRHFLPGKRDIDSLMHFVKKGNRLFLSIENCGTEFFDTLSHQMVRELLLKQATEPYEIPLDDYENVIAPPSAEPYQEEAVYDEYEEEYSDEYEEEYEAEYTEVAESNDPYSTLYSAYEASRFFELNYVERDSIFLHSTDSTIKSVKQAFLYEFDTISHAYAEFDYNYTTFSNAGIVETRGFFTNVNNANSIHYVNYITIKLGKGEIHLHLAPISLTNLNMLRQKDMLYARSIFDQMGTGKVFWGEDTRYQESSEEKNNESLGKGDRNEGPLEWILSEPMLRKGWYVLLLAVVLYMIFGVKRKQRIIPVIEKKQNTSIEYAEVISQLFMEQSDHSKLVDLKMDIFKSILLDKYHLRIPVDHREENQAFFKNVAI
ncbi:MAG: hypothetical protein ACOYLH_11565, partial [Flavobacteriales bacterium]